jgi:ABC-type uncharacterized transport system substrate-binding protein
MRRREFITLLGGTVIAWPLAARAQQSKMARIGALYIGIADAESFKTNLREGLRELGYMEGKNIVFEFRSAEEKLDRLPQLAAELVRLNVDVIVALYTPPALAAKQATQDIPIVMIAGDPVETGIVPSLAHPGGNITGVSLMASVLTAKGVDLFRDMLPSVRRVGVLGRQSNRRPSCCIVAASNELHPIPHRGGTARRRISKPQRSVTGYRGHFATGQRGRGPVWVMNGPKATSALSPFDSQLRTLVAAARRSHSCHNRS